MPAHAIAANDGVASSSEETAGPRTRVRWVICALLFFATTINYVDRGVLGVLAPDLQKTIGWTDTQYGDINAAFSLAYAIGFVVVGRFVDRVGTKIGYAVALVLWSLAAAGHALAQHGAGLRDRAVLPRAGRGGELPVGDQDDRRVVPPPRARLRHGDLQRRLEHRRRARPAGRAGAGAARGAGSRPSSSRGCSGWSGSPSGSRSTDRPERHPRVSPAELAWIQSDPPEPSTPIPWLQLLPHRQTWAFAAGKFLTDPIWWFYLFWSAKFLADKFGVDLKQIGPPLIVIYLLADVGSVGGGWLSSWLLKRGWTPNAARKTALLACALCVVPVAAAPVVSNLWTAVLLICAGGRGAPGVLGEPVHPHLGHVPPPRGRLGRRHRRHGRRHRRHPHAVRLGTDQGADRQLPDDVRHRRLGLPPRGPDHPRRWSPRLEPVSLKPHRWPIRLEE